MKTSIYILFLFGLLIHLSCTQWVEEVEPENTLTVENAFSTKEDLELALTGCYHLIKEVDPFGRQGLFMAELMSGNVQYFGSGFGYTEIGELRIDPYNQYVESHWITTYKALNQLNIILDRIDEVAAQQASFSKEEQDHMRGEALFLRAFLYFDLVRLFALPYNEQANQNLGVPLVLEPVIQSSALTFPARASVASVYAQINIDLEQAAALMGNTTSPGLAHSFAAKALLARVKFQQQKYAEADQLAREVLESGFALTPTPQEFFRLQGSTEDIWSTEPSDGLVWAFGSASRASDDLRQYGFDSLLLPRHKEALSRSSYFWSDLRKDTGQWTTDPLLTPDSLFSLKYSGDKDDTPVLRLGEFVLLRAETAARTGDTETALDLLNQIRRRAMRIWNETGMEIAAPELFAYEGEDFPDTESLIDAIVRERRVELVFEGNYYFDQLRLRRSIQGLPWDDNRLRLPIPQRELDANPNLVQNPGY